MSKKLDRARARVNSPEYNQTTLSPSRQQAARDELRRIEFNCLECGACCVSEFDQADYCDITDEDKARMGARLMRYVNESSSFLQYSGAIKTEWREQKTGKYKGLLFCSCHFLRGSVMSKVRCSIYAKRPSICRSAMQPGDYQCRRAREVLEDLVKRAHEPGAQKGSV